jgi:coiled-coil domain-containing protein 55
MMQREREAEGDMYQDKETFVTQAYKDQMEEVRKAEEEEKRREGRILAYCVLAYNDLCS